MSVYKAVRVLHDPGNTHYIVQFKEAWYQLSWSHHRAFHYKVQTEYGDSFAIAQEDAEKLALKEAARLLEHRVIWEKRA